MRRRLPRWWLGLVALLIGWFAALPVSAAPAPRVYVLTIAGPINPTAARYVQRGLEAAARARAEAVVIRLDTPGGLDGSMRAIVQAMIASSVPVVVYVAPPGARAASAGMVITIAAHVAAMAPDTAIGAAHPVGSGGEELKGPMADKVTNDAVAFVKGLAAARGRNAQWAEAAVRKSVSATASEAVALHVVDLTAPNLPALLQRIDGRRVMLAIGPHVLATRGATLVEAPMSGAERVLDLLANPTVALLLLNLGVLGLVFELQNPGAMLPGVAGVICLLLGLFALGMLEVSWAGLALIGFGLALFIAELFLPTYGILAVGGVVALVLGALMLFPAGSELAPSLPLVLTIALSTGALVLAAMALAWRAQRRRPATGREELIGRVAVVRTPLAPSGMVLLEGELWQAELPPGAPPATAGEKVRVERVDGLKLFVTIFASNRGT